MCSLVTGRGCSSKVKKIFFLFLSDNITTMRCESFFLHENIDFKIDMAYLDIVLALSASNLALINTFGSVDGWEAFLTLLLFRLDHAC